MENPTAADLDMIEALLATMQQNPGQLYDDIDDDDDDDYDDDDDEDDDDEDGYYGEHHNIQTVMNPYGGGNSGGAGEGSDDGDIGGSNSNVQLSSAHTMNFLQNLLNMSNSIPGMAEVEAALGSSMAGGIDGMAAPLEGGSGSFLPSMQNLIPNMNSQMAGALAGAFAGGMGSLIDYGTGRENQDYDDDDDALSDDDDDDDDEDDEDDDGDVDDDDDKHEILSNAALVAGGTGLMAGLLSSVASNHPSNNVPYREPFPSNAVVQSHLAALPAPSAISPPIGFSPPTQLVADITAPTPSPISLPPLGFSVPTPIPSTPANNIIPFIPAASNATSIIGSNMNGGTVSKADPLAALMAGAGGICLGAGVLTPMVTNLLGNGGGSAVVNKINTSDIPRIIESPNASFNGPNRIIGKNTLQKFVAGAAIASAACSVVQNKPTMSPANMLANAKVIPGVQQNIVKQGQRKTKEECEDDKASLDSDFVSGSEGSGGGKSDTESVGKKTPSPVPEGTESTHGQENGSCASITDLASATESMRDSDTDNHSEVHNVTANLSDADSDIHEQRKIHAQAHYQVGSLPVVVERPTYGWGSMHGLDKAKESLKELFYVRSFPKVFDGMEDLCKGILLFGPSCSGKTCLARALAKEANNSLFVGINSRYLLAHHPLDVTKLVRWMFDEARINKPAVVLFDEIDSLSYPNSESALQAKDEIMAQVRGTTTTRPGYPTQQPNDGILVLGTTNQPWCLEDRMRRLFAYNIHVKLPGEKARHELFRMFLKNVSNTLSEDEFNCLVSKSERYSAADINSVIRQASQRVVPLANGSSPVHPCVTYDNLATCMTDYKCRFNDELEQNYNAYIRAATHRSEELQDSSKDKKDKTKGVRKFRRLGKTLAAAFLAVID